jgi:hypothetical protein
MKRTNNELILKAAFIYGLVLLAFLMSGCAEYHFQHLPDTLKVPAQAIKVSAASLDHCPTGGFVYTTFTDVIPNGVWDATEPILSSQTVCNGINGQNGNNGVSMGIDVSTATTLVCPFGGSKIVVFKDLNSDGLLDNSDSITAITSVCNGANGMNGTNGINGTSASISVQSATAMQCSTGGYVFTSTGNPSVVVCNGNQGTQGIQGPSGQAGTQVIPIKFCSNDSSAFPEYGLMVGDQVFAVYWGVTPSSPNKEQSFLALLTPGSYKSTGGNNCNFTVN